MQCPDCAHEEDDSAFEDKEDDSFVCPECDYFWIE